MASIASFVVNHPDSARLFGGDGGTIGSVEEVSGADRQSSFVEQLGSMFASVTGVTVGPQDPLMASGLDSLGSVEFQDVVSKTLGLDLPNMLIFDYPTLSALAEYVDSRVPRAAAHPSCSGAGMCGSAVAQDKRQFFVDQLVGMFEAVTGIAVGVDEPLMSSGLDSLSTVEFQNVIS